MVSLFPCCNKFPVIYVVLLPFPRPLSPVQAHHDKKTASGGEPAVRLGDLTGRHEGRQLLPHLLVLHDRAKETEPNIPPAITTRAEAWL